MYYVNVFLGSVMLSHTKSILIGGIAVNLINWPNTTTSLTENGFYEYLFQANQHLGVYSDCGALAAVWRVASATTPGAIEATAAAVAMPLLAVAVPQAHSLQPGLGLVIFSPSAWRMEANQAWAIMERVM